MFLAHGPLGYGLVAAYRRLTKTRLSRRQHSQLLLAGFLSAISLDLDIVPYYVMDLPGSHREFFTHTPHFVVLFSAVLAAFLFIAMRKREKFHVALWGVISFGMLSHVLADSLGNGVRWLYPSERLYGLALAHPLFDTRFFLINFGLEILIAAFFVWHLLRRWRWWNAVAWRKALGPVLALSILVVGEIAVVQIHRHSYQSKGSLYYGDLDNDGKFNAGDDNMDGDAFYNIDDADANGNGLTNEEDAVAALEDMRDVWYDPLKGSFIDMFMRLGFFIHSDVVYKAYDNAGIFLVGELHEQKNDHPETPFEGNVFDSVDVRRARNLFIFMEANNLLVERPAKAELGDMAFIDGGEMVGIVSSFGPDTGYGSHGPGDPSITLVVPTEEVMEYTLDHAERTIGDVTHYGRLSLGYQVYPGASD